MNEDLKTLLMELSAQAAQYNCDSTGMLFALARYAFPDASTSEIARIARMGRATAYRMEAKGFVFVPSQMSQASHNGTVEMSQVSHSETLRKEKERKDSPHTPLIKKEKEISFPQTPNGGFPPGPQGGSAQESLHDVLNNIKQDYYKSHGIVTTAETYTSVGADTTQVDNTPKRDLVNPQEFQKLWDDYPKRKGMQGGVAYEKVRHLWMQLEESGWGYEINTALKAALVSKRWSENNGQFIPTVFNFLENEEFRQFLPTGYKPRKPQPKSEQKPLEGGIYDLL
jgi:hypothetical protein